MTPDWKKMIAALGALLGTLAVTACNRTQDCGDGGCDSGDADAGNEGPKEDLPPSDIGTATGEDCGGADLETDRLNCGECGHSCSTSDTYGHAVGECVEGKCSPTWTTCQKASYGKSCAEICEKKGHTCAAQGCDGLTAIFLTEASDSATGCVGEDMGLTIGCEEPLPWSADPFTERVFCCCEQD